MVCFQTFGLFPRIFVNNDLSVKSGQAMFEPGKEKIPALNSRLVNFFLGIKKI